MKKIWNMIRRISGKGPPVPVNQLKVNNVTIDSPRDIANALGSTLSYNNSSAHYTDIFRRYKAVQEKLPLNIHSDNLGAYNRPFSKQELEMPCTRRTTWHSVLIKFIVSF
jgi:hypothetical protein